MDSPIERRRFSRIQVSLPVEYEAMPADSGDPFQGQGVLRDISLGGTYFHVEPDTYFQKGQILSLTISGTLRRIPPAGHRRGNSLRTLHPHPAPTGGGAAIFGRANFLYLSPPANVLNLELQKTHLGVKINIPNHINKLYI